MKTHSLLPLSLPRILVLTLGVGVLVPVAASGQEVPVLNERGSVTDPKRADREFMEKAAKMSMSEAAISRVAVARTTNPEVRRFAQMMVQDHESAMKHLTELASTRGVALPAKDPTPEKWEKRDAKDFDKAYLDQMIDDHEKAVKLFEKQAKVGHETETVAFARKQLPKLQHHLQQAIDLKRALSGK